MPEPKSHRGFYTKDQIKLLVDESLKMEDGLLLHRSLLFLYLTCCRKGELLALKWHTTDKFGKEWLGVDFENNVINFVDTKNGTNHQISIHPQLLPMLQEMHHERLDELEVFQWNTKDSIYNRIKQLLEHCGLENVKRPIHQIRHSSATHMISAGVNLRHVQSVLNHADISTTNGYAKTEDHVKAAAVDSWRSKCQEQRRNIHNHYHLTLSTNWNY